MNSGGQVKGALAGIGVWLAVCAAAAAQVPSVIARAVNVSGLVMLTNASGVPAFALNAGYTLNPGDRIDTRGGGRVVIDLTDGSVVVVQPETVLVIKDYRAAESLRELFQITLGLVRVKINHFVGRPNPYRMNSPTASVAVRGTEFSIAVDATGETKVEVYEGTVEVSSLDDPNRSTLVESGYGVIVRAGQDLLLYANPVGRDVGQRSPPARGDGDHRPQARPDDSGPTPPPREMAEHGSDPDRPGTPPPGPNVPVPPPGASQHGGPAQAGPPPGGPPHSGPDARQPGNHSPAPGGHPDGPENHAQMDENSPRATASTYDRFIAGLTDLGQVPFTYRYNAFPELHLDSFENPAYATAFHSAEGRLFILPTWSGANELRQNSATFGSAGSQPANYSISPQFSMFVPVGGGRFVLGGNVTASHLGSSGQTLVPGFGGGTAASGLLTTDTSSAGTFSSVMMIGATRFGANSAGFSVERLRASGWLNSLSATGGTGSVPVEQIDSGSSIYQTRVTAGLSRSFAQNHTIGGFFRYGFIDASDAENDHTLFGQPVNPSGTHSAGHSAEAGMRVRGPITPKIFYGITAGWMGVSLTDALGRLVAADSHQRDGLWRGTVSFGLGVLADAHTVLSFDVSAALSRIHAARAEDLTGNLLQLGSSRNGALSVHAAIQRDITRHLFGTASILSVARGSRFAYLLFPDHLGNQVLVTNLFFPIAPVLQGTYFSDFGAGWRFTPNVTLQYVYSTDYGVSSGSHALMLRYTFHPRGE